MRLLRTISGPWLPLKTSWAQIQIIILMRIWVPPVWPALHKQGKCSAERPGHLTKTPQWMCGGRSVGWVPDLPHPGRHETLQGSSWFSPSVRPEATTVTDLLPKEMHIRTKVWTRYPVGSQTPHIPGLKPLFRFWGASATERGVCVTGSAPPVSPVCVPHGCPFTVCFYAVTSPPLGNPGLNLTKNLFGQTLLKQLKHFLTHINTQTFAENQGWTKNDYLKKTQCAWTSRLWDFVKINYSRAP